MQPFVIDEHETVRFKENKIVSYLLDHGGIDMNQLASIDFSQDDRTQFYQLIGYSLSGFHELSRVSDKDALQASQNASIQFKKTIKACRDDNCVVHCGVPLEDDPEEELHKCLRAEERSNRKKTS